MKEKGLEIKSMHIKYVFTEEEKKDIAIKLALKVSEKQDLEDRKKEVSSQLTAEINKASTEMSMYSKQINQGYTFKNHDCNEVFDYDLKQVFTHRADTDEEVGVRTMTSAEFQREMFDPREEIKDDPDFPESVKLAIRYSKEYPAEFKQACRELDFRSDAPEKFVDASAIPVCEKVRELLDYEEIPDDTDKSLLEDENLEKE